MLSLETEYPGGGLPPDDPPDEISHHARHRWRVAYSILIRDRSRLDLGVDELLVPSHPDSVAFAFDAPTAADAIEMAGVKLQEYRRTRLHQAGEFICAFRMVDVEWLGPESPGAARDGSSPAASDDLPHLPNPLQHEPPNGDT